MDNPGSILTSRLKQVEEILPESLRHSAVIKSFQLSLAEDLQAEGDYIHLMPDPAVGDITSLAILESGSHLTGQITAKAPGVIAGMPVIMAISKLMDPKIDCKPLVKEGNLVQAGTRIVEIAGPGTSLLAVERTLLNFLGRMSGIASLTRRFVQAIEGTSAIILDTRKTVPGLRHIDKYAVKVGGGQNHRMGLFDMVMIKDNHIDGAGGITEAVNRVRQRYGDKYQIEVEVKNLDELRIALDLNVDRIMLDNMDLATMEAAVKFVNHRIPLEASGNVTVDTVAAIARTGVDFISSGALTHSVPVLDISLRLR